jgi:hypothetical protein
MTTRGCLIATALVLAASANARAQDEACAPARPVIRSDKGLTFEADAFARPEWRERSSGGRTLTYATEIWRGRIDGRRAYLTFDLIPGTSGPNHFMDYRLRRYPARVAWRTEGTRYDLGRWFVIRSGPLTGEWTVQNCGGGR